MLGLAELSNWDFAVLGTGISVSYTHLTLDAQYEKEQSELTAEISALEKAIKSYETHEKEDVYKRQIEVRPLVPKGVCSSLISRQTAISQIGRAHV